MNDDDLRKLANYIVELIGARLLGGGPGIAELLADEAEEDPEEEKRKEEERILFQRAWAHITGVSDD